MIDLKDPEQRRLAAETLRLAAESIEAGQGEWCDVRVEDHHHEAFVSRFVAAIPSGAKRVTIHVAIVATPRVASKLLPGDDGA